MTCLKKMRAEVEFMVTYVPHLWSLDLSRLLNRVDKTVIVDNSSLIDSVFF